MAVFDQEVDAFSGELALAGLEQQEGEILPLEGVRVLDELKEARLEINRDFLGDVRQAAGVRHEFTHARLERGNVRSEHLGQLVANRGAEEPLRGVELVAVLDRGGELVEHREQVGGGLLGGDGDQFHGQLDAAARRAGVVELLDDLILRRHGFVAEHIAFSLLGGNRDPRILGDQFLGRRPPFLEPLFAQRLLQDDLQIDRGGCLVGKGGEGLDDQLDRLLIDQLFDLFRLDLLAHEEVSRRQHIERAEAKRWIHPVFRLALEIDQ